MSPLDQPIISRALTRSGRLRDVSAESSEPGIRLVFGRTRLLSAFASSSFRDVDLASPPHFKWAALLSCLSRYISPAELRGKHAFKSILAHVIRPHGASRFDLAARSAAAKLVLRAASLCFVILLVAAFALAKARREMELSGTGQPAPDGRP